MAGGEERPDRTRVDRIRVRARSEERRNKRLLFGLLACAEMSPR